MLRLSFLLYIPEAENWKVKARGHVARLKVLIWQLLSTLVNYLIIVILPCPFWKKGRKTWAHGKNLHKCPLLTPHIASPRSGTCSSLQAFACFQGAAELDLRDYTKKVILAQIFRQPRTMAWKQAALHWIFQRCPFAFSDGLPLQWDAQ